MQRARDDLDKVTKVDCEDSILGPISQIADLAAEMNQIRADADTAFQTYLDNKKAKEKENKVPVKASNVVVAAKKNTVKTTHSRQVESFIDQNRVKEVVIKINRLKDVLRYITTHSRMAESRGAIRDVKTAKPMDFDSALEVIQSAEKSKNELLGREAVALRVLLKEALEEQKTGQGDVQQAQTELDKTNKLLVLEAADKEKELRIHKAHTNKMAGNKK